MECPTDPQSIPDPLLKYTVTHLWKSPEWEQYHNDINKFENAYKFITLVLEKLALEEFAERAADQSMV